MVRNLYEIEKQNLEQLYNRLLRSNHDIKLLQLQLLWKYLHSAISFSPIIDQIKANYHRFWNIGNSIFHSVHPPRLLDDYQERAYATYYLFDIMLRETRSHYPMSDIGKKFNRDKNDHDLQANFDLFNDLFLEQFVMYFLSQVNRNMLALGLLKKYKTRSEWFNDEELFFEIQRQSAKAERHLKRDLYRYLSDQGLELLIEPQSPSGETDLIAIENTGLERTVIEAKIFDGSSRGVAYIIKGFHQLCSYLKDYGEHLGYLLVYNTGPSLLSLTLDTGTIFPYVKRDNRIIYIVIVDIFVHDLPASKRRKRTTIELKGSELL